MSKKNKYSNEFKKQILLLYLSSDFSATEIANINNIHPDTVQRWVRQYKSGRFVINNMVDKEINENKLNNTIICNLLYNIEIIENELNNIKLILKNKLDNIN